MKFALIDGDRCEPVPGATARCPGCGQEVIARCGAQRIWHWAHKGRRSCDSWWEPETEWHRAWKNLFPLDWQEVPCRADDGELHIADILTPKGLVLEFQHSAIKPEERLSRERFYKNMLWIVDGSRLKNDRPRIDREVRGWRNLATMKLQVAADPGAIFPKRWIDANAPVFFDFDGIRRDEDFPEEREGGVPSVLRDDTWWSTRGARPDPMVCLLPSPRDLSRLYFAMRREKFIDAVKNDPAALNATRIMQDAIKEQVDRQKIAMSMKGGRGRRRF